MILDIIQKIDSKEPVVVAVSGGPDSMALLSLLENYFNTIICAHVNHNTGRIGQDEDELFVKEYCKKHDHIFETMKIEHYDSTNFHNQAHKKRYHFFEIILQKYHSHYLFTAHHGDDLIETMLFRMIRGSTVNAIHGFSFVSEKNGYYIIRPLLRYTKEQLLEYDNQNHIPYRLDPSNEKEIYTRNRIRKNILPYLKKEQKNVHLKFLSFSEEISEMEQLIQKVALKEKEKRFQQNILTITEWQKLDSIVQKRVLQLILKELYRNDQEVLESIHIKLLQDFILSAQSGAKLSLPKHRTVVKEYQTVFFSKKEACDYELEIHSITTLPNGHEIKIVKEEQTDSNFVCRLNIEEVMLPLFVRTRKPQDRINVKGLGASKKVKEIFIDEKVPLHLRNSWPIVTDKTGKIVWIPGLKKSQFDKTKEQKYDIILKYY